MTRYDPAFICAAKRVLWDEQFHTLAEIFEECQPHITPASAADFFRSKYPNPKVPLPLNEVVRRGKYLILQHWCRRNDMETEGFGMFTKRYRWRVPRCPLCGEKMDVRARYDVRAVCVSCKAAGKGVKGKDKVLRETSSA